MSWSALAFERPSTDVAPRHTYRLRLGWIGVCPRRKNHFGPRYVGSWHIFGSVASECRSPPHSGRPQALRAIYGFTARFATDLVRASTKRWPFHTSIPANGDSRGSASNACALISTSWSVEQSKTSTATKAPLAL